MPDNELVLRNNLTYEMTSISILVSFQPTRTLGSVGDLKYVRALISPIFVLNKSTTVVMPYSWRYFLRPEVSFLPRTLSRTWLNAALSLSRLEALVKGVLHCPNKSRSRRSGP